MKIVVLVLLVLVHCELTISAALNRKHYFINEPKTWEEAQKYCREYYDDLSCVYDTTALLGLKSAVNTGTVNSSIKPLYGNPYYYISAWIGLNKISSSDWKWCDGSLYNGQISVSSDYNTSNNCATFYSNVLFGFSCEIQQPFFCYKWVPELILVREKKSWEDALQHCRTYYSDLAVLPSYIHITQAKQTTAIAETASVWTGLRFLSGLWFWVNGEDLGSLVQLPTCPANYSYCGALNQTTRRWNNKDCMEKLNFVCY